MRKAQLINSQVLNSFVEPTFEFEFAQSNFNLLNLLSTFCLFFCFLVRLAKCLRANNPNSPAASAAGEFSREGGVPFEQSLSKVPEVPPRNVATETGGRVQNSAVHTGL